MHISYRAAGGILAAIDVVARAAVTGWLSVGIVFAISMVCGVAVVIGVAVGIGVIVGLSCKDLSTFDRNQLSS